MEGARPLWLVCPRQTFSCQESQDCGWRFDSWEETLFRLLCLVGKTSLDTQWYGISTNRSWSNCKWPLQRTSQKPLHFFFFFLFLNSCNILFVNSCDLLAGPEADSKWNPRKVQNQTWNVSPLPFSSWMFVIKAKGGSHRHPRGTLTVAVCLVLLSVVNHRQIKHSVSVTSILHARHW